MNVFLFSWISFPICISGFFFFSSDIYDERKEHERKIITRTHSHTHRHTSMFCSNHDLIFFPISNTTKEKKTCQKQNTEEDWFLFMFWEHNKYLKYDNGMNCHIESHFLVAFQGHSLFSYENLSKFENRFIL